MSSGGVSSKVQRLTTIMLDTVEYPLAYELEFSLFKR